MMTAPGGLQSNAAGGQAQGAGAFIDAMATVATDEWPQLGFPGFDTRLGDDEIHPPSPPLAFDSAEEAAPHVRFKKGEWFTWVPGISHLNNQNIGTRFWDSWWHHASLDSYIKEFSAHSAIVSNLYSGGDFCCNGMSGLGGGGVQGYVTNLSAGTYDVTYWYHVTLRATGKAQASAIITEGTAAILHKAVHGTDPVATYDSKLQTRTVQVTVGALGDAQVFTYTPGATTPHGASVLDNATVRGEFGIIGIKEVSPK